MNKEEILLSLLADTIPSHPNEFYSETEFANDDFHSTMGVMD